MRLCINCGGELVSSSAKSHSDQKFCSHRCYVQFRFVPQNEHKCEVCEKKFKAYNSRPTAKYCSRKCYYKAPKSEEFRQKISEAFRGEKHPRWKGGVMKGRKDRNLAVYKNWRNEVFARDNYTCQECGIKNHKGLGRTVKLEADHIKSWTDYPELRYEVGNGRALCKDCHSKRTGEQHKERMSYATI